MSPRRIAFAATVAACLLAACGSAHDSTAEALAEQARESSREIEVRSEAGTNEVTVEGQDGRYRHTTGENVSLPEDFPADVRLPDGYTVLSVMTMGPTQSVVLRSDASMSAIFEHFKSAQADEGWKETVSMQGAEGSMLGFEKDERGVLVNLRPDIEGNTIVSLSLQPAR